MDQRVYIWGAGAIGGIIGAHLARSGQNVLLVDSASDHVACMAKNGLSIEGPCGEFSVPVRATTPDRLSEQADIILLAVKSQHTEAACQTLLPYLSSNGYVVSCQNGLNEPLISEIVGRERTVGAFVNFAGDYLGPGRIIYGLQGTVAIGELNGARTPRLEALRHRLGYFEPNTVISDDIFGYLWAKTAYGAVLIASALTNDSIADFIADPARRPLIKALVREVLKIALADGVTPLSFDTFEPSAFLAGDEIAMNKCLDALAAFNRDTGKTHSGIWRDLAVRKRKTEVASHFEAVERTAGRLGLSVPLFQSLAQAIADIEAGRREQGKKIADELCACVASSSAANVRYPTFD